ncbi:ligand-gated channel [Campylobacter sp. MIT 12-8780]|uniref:TonB-dependent receptor domain-containing protein n=1 Tax=Campylobacter sp. MIT 12-8780 TaxID=2202200 RepID=UPI00115E408B|nr:TonB-dependent receptor [Campylobacter sp. MIT 12-8780]TQR41293.1 ligand-gated channel [Campylobacter sp. MIT 12-8780]
MKLNFKLSIAAILLLAGGGHLNAEETHTLESSVISASGFEQDIKDAPASISVITSEELNSRPIKDIGEAIQDIPGVDVSMNKTGTYDYSIRGFGSAYTLVLIDGKRQSVANGFYSNGFDGSESGYMPPLAMIERIEVIRGPASTLYGTDAVGGVINIITKKMSNEVSGSIALDTQLQQHPDLYGNAGSMNGYISTPLIEDKLSFSARIKYYSKNESSHLWPSVPYNNGTQRPANFQIPSHSPGKLTALNIGGRFNFVLDEANSFYFDYEHYDNNIVTRSTSGQAIRSDRVIKKDNFVGNYDGSFAFGSINSYAQYGRTWDKELVSQIIVGETKAVLPFDLGAAGNLVGSFGARADYEVLTDDTAGSRGSTNILQGKNIDQITAALYGEGEYFITEDFIFTTGLRWVYSDLFKSEFTPRVYAIYHITDDIALKGGIAKGYKTPQAKQIRKGRYSSSATSDAYGNPDLKPEESINYELGVDFNLFDYANYTITGFLTDFKNQISTQNAVMGDILPNGVTCNASGGCTYPINLGKTQAKGIEFAFKSAKFYDFRLSSSYTFIENVYKDGVLNVLGGTRVENKPKHIISAKLDHEYGKFNSFLKFRGKFNTIARAKGGNNRPLTNAGGTNIEKYKPFYTFDLGTSYKIDKNSTLSFMIYNLFDKDFFDPIATGRDATTGNPSGYANLYQDYTEGRSFWMHYKYDF